MLAMLQPLLLTLLGAAGTGLGGLLVVLQPQMCFKRLGALQGLAAGLMLSISLIDLLPEAVEEIGFIPANLCFYAGVLFFAAIVALMELSKPEPDAMFAAAAGDQQSQHQQQQQQRHSQQSSFPLSVKLSTSEQQPASTPLAPKTPVPTSAQQPAPYAYDLTQLGGSSSSEGRDQGTIRRRSNAAGASLAPSAARLETSAGGMQPADPPTQQQQKQQQQQQQVSASPTSPASSCGCSTDLAVLLNEDGSGSGGGSNSTEEDRRHKRQLLMSGLITAVGIALHNFPEGIAVLLASQKSTAVGVSLAAAIGLHNVPEGVAVALPVYFATGSRWRGLQTAVLSGLAEPLAVVLLGLLLPFMQLNKHVVDGMLAGVGGIMAFLAFHELLPLSMQHAGRPLAVGCLFGGMGLMSLTLHYLNTHVLADLH